MKICLPIEIPNGADSLLSISFDLADDYMMFDSESGACEIYNEKEKSEESSDSGNPLANLIPGGADAIITKGLRSSAFIVLKRCGLKMFKAGADSAGANIKLFQDGMLKELEIEDLTPGKSCGSSCSTCSSSCK